MTGGQHCLYLAESHWDAYNVVFSWIQRHLKDSKTAIIYAAETNLSKLVDLLNSAGIDADRHIEEGRLNLMDINEICKSKKGYKSQKTTIRYLGIVNHLFHEGFNSFLMIGSGATYFRNGRTRQIIDYERGYGTDQQHGSYSISTLCYYHIKSIYCLGFGQLINLLQSHSYMALPDNKKIPLDSSLIIKKTIEEIFEEQIGHSSGEIIKLIINSGYEGNIITNPLVIEKNIKRFLGSSCDMICSDIKESILSKLFSLIKNNM